jgi:hypothetical protein
MPTAPTIEQDIYVGQDFYVPAYRVKVRGKELMQVENDVLSVTYTDTDNKDSKKEKEMDSFDLTVNNWDPDGKGQGMGWFKYSDTDVFNPWQDVELFLGYYREGNDELARMLVGEIVRMTPNFPASGASTLTVHCVNLLQRFRTTQVTTFRKRIPGLLATWCRASPRTCGRRSRPWTCRWMMTRSIATWPMKKRFST